MTCPAGPAAAAAYGAGAAGGSETPTCSLVARGEGAALEKTMVGGTFVLCDRGDSTNNR